MSKINEKLIEIEEMLRAGMDVDTIAIAADVPSNWVIQVDLELMCKNQRDYEDTYAPPYSG